MNPTLKQAVVIIKADAKLKFSQKIEVLSKEDGLLSDLNIMKLFYQNDYDDGKVSDEIIKIVCKVWLNQSFE